ncbi:MAG TPA: hypothetical protein VI233_00470, partial [Puia sp.]
MQSRRILLLLTALSLTLGLPASYGQVAASSLSDEPASSEAPGPGNRSPKDARHTHRINPVPALSTRLSGVENYALNRPGIVMIKTEYSANVYVNSMKMDNRAFNHLLDSIQNLDHGGGVTAEQKLDMMLREMNLNPEHYFKTTFDYI